MGSDRPILDRKTRQFAKVTIPRHQHGTENHCRRRKPKVVLVHRKSLLLSGTLHSRVSIRRGKGDGFCVKRSQKLWNPLLDGRTPPSRRHSLDAEQRLSADDDRSDDAVWEYRARHALHHPHVPVQQVPQSVRVEQVDHQSAKVVEDPLVPHGQLPPLHCLLPLVEVFLAQLRQPPSALRIAAAEPRGGSTGSTTSISSSRPVGKSTEPTGTKTLPSKCARSLAMPPLYPLL